MKDEFFYIRDNSLAERIIQKITEGKKLHFSIENFLTHTILLGDAKKAVEDMRKRLEE